MKKIIFALCVIGFLTSCNTDKIAIGEFEIKDGSGIIGLKMKGDGTLTVRDEVVGKVDKTGRIMDVNGKEVAKIEGESIVDAKGKEITKVGEDGSFKNSGTGERLHWNENGELLKGEEKTGMVISPNDKSLYKAASIVLLMYFTIPASQ
jgi:hypothetical protein